MRIHICPFKALLGAIWPDVDDLPHRSFLPLILRLSTLRDIHAFAGVEHYEFSSARVFRNCTNINCRARIAL